MANNFTPRKPDYQVSALDKDSELRGNIGAAWNQPDGSIQIKLNAFTVLDTTKHNLVISLFPPGWNKADGGKIRSKPVEVQPDPVF